MAGLSLSRARMLVALSVAGAVACTNLSGLTSSGDDGGANPGDPSGPSHIAAGGLCEPGFATCPTKGANACNTPIATDRDNCGACDAPCFSANTLADPVCVNGACVFQCGFGFADCNHLGRDGCEAAFATDAHNCGGCGHDCKGGACESGVCQPLLIGPSGAVASGYTAPMILDATSAYWFANGALAACPKAGCTKATMLSSPTLGGTALAVDDTTLFFTGTSDDKLRSATKATDTVTVIGPTAQPQPYAVAADGTNVYFTTITNLTSHDGHISSCPRAGCGGATPSALTATQYLPQHLVVTGTRLLWTTGNAGVWTCTLPACADAAKLVSMDASRIATDGTTLYFGYGGGSLYACALSGCSDSPTLLVTTTDTFASIAVDASAVYLVVNRSTGPYQYSVDVTILSCPKSGCTTPKTVTHLVQAMGGVEAIAADADFLYWINGTDLVRVVKP